MKYMQFGRTLFLGLFLASPVFLNSSLHIIWIYTPLYILTRFLYNKRMKFRLHFVVPCSLWFENRFENFNTIYCNTTILYGCVTDSIPYAVSDNLNPFHFRNDSNKKTRTWHRKTQKPIIQTFVIVKIVALRIAHSSLAQKKNRENNAT